VDHVAPMQFVPTLPPEEAARANFYGLLARLFYAPPDAPLLQAIAAAEDLDAEQGAMTLAWRELAHAAAAADLEVVGGEYDRAFFGVGKAPVTLYTCAYSIRYSNEVPLVDLKAALAGLGLARRQESNEPEDHIAALCDVMRHLISVKFAPLEEQRIFFERWIWPTGASLCGAIEKSDLTHFYRAVAQFAKAFFELEHDAFEML
jgi:TorA maturation chaperone TorD